MAATIYNNTPTELEQLVSSSSWLPLVSRWQVPLPPDRVECDISGTQS